MASALLPFFLGSGSRPWKLRTLVATFAAATALTGCSYELCDRLPCGTGGNGAAGGNQGGDGGVSDGAGGAGGATGGGGTGGEGGSIPPECVPFNNPDVEIDDTACPGLFVAANADSGGNGSKAMPFQKLSEAIAELDATVHVIYVCEGTYDQEADSIEVPEGTFIYGGLSCDWRYTGDRALFVGVENVPVLTFSGAGAREMDDCDVRAPNATGTTGTQGNSSIGILVAGASVTIARSKIEAGTGFLGPNGAAPAGPANQAPNGMPGDQGCLDSMANDGGPGGQNTSCPLPAGGTADVSGGTGGDGDNDPSGNPGDAGGPDFMGGTAGGAQIGAGSCTPGGNGLPGNPAGMGAKATPTNGVISGLGYQGPVTPAAPVGEPGRGGGGGGGAKECNGNINTGPGGGGGGAGGCGGAGGKGGGAGGGSIAIAAASNAILTLSNLVLVAAGGGDGGVGATGQLGQPGGRDPNFVVGGAPGAGDAQAIACQGGAGGKGGDGGPGAGGDGGVTALIALAAGATANRTGETTSDMLGPAANPGNGASGGVTGNNSVACESFNADSWVCN